MSGIEYKKSDEFVLIVQSMVLAASAKQPIALHAIAAIMASAVTASRSIPENRDAFSCALEFAEAQLPEYADDRASASYRLPTWLKEETPDPWNPGQEPTEVLVDGRWQVENPLWVGLPGNRSANLEILAALREKSPQTIDDLASAGCGSPASVRKRLKNLQKEGFVEQSFKDPFHWSLSFHPEIDRRPKT